MALGKQGLILMTSAALAACAGHVSPPVDTCIHDQAERPMAMLSETELTVPARGGGVLAGTMIAGDPNAQAVLILPGSGPTDRNGDSVMGVKGGIYRQLAEGLRAHGIASLRADKRGLGGSKVDGDPNAVTIADYLDDAGTWRDQLLLHGHRCVWLAGHSEGGLIALAMAAEHPDHLCGVVLLAAPGRKMDAILKSQLQPKLPPEMYAPVDAAIDRLARGERVDPATLPAPVQRLFAPQVQGFLSDMMRYDPAALAARTKLPILILQGEEDLQVTAGDAQALKAAQPRAELVLLDGTNHVFKTVPKGDMAANAASYGNADMRIDSRVIDLIARFVTR